MHRLNRTLVVAGLLQFCAPTEGRAKPAACTSGRFAVTQGELIVGTEASGSATILFDYPTIAIGTSCAPKHVGRVRRTTTGTRIVTRWRRCGTMARHIALDATIDETCAHMTGHVRVGRQVAPTPFAASLLPDCAGEPTTRCRFEMGEAECAAHDGDFGRHGFSQQLSCLCRTSDAGVSCQRACACQGLCIAPTAHAPVGTCSEHVIEFGCFYLIDGAGQTGDGAWCID